MFKVEKGIPDPGRKTHPKEEIYPWKKMAVDDSFFVPNKTDISVRYHAARRYGHKYRQRQVDGGVRIWRIE